MFKDTMEMAVLTTKFMMLGFSCYAVVVMTKPEELELRTGQLRQWWSGLIDGRPEQVSAPNPDTAPGDGWGF